MENKNTNYGQSVTAVVIRNNKVLLARHTYGAGKGMLIIPGGYVEYGETPQHAVKREYREETGIEIEPKQIIGIRFHSHDWYVAFSAEYISGEATSDGDENNEVVWMDIDEALLRDDVPDLTKKLIVCAQKADHGLEQIPYIGRSKHGESFLYGSK